MGSNWQYTNNQANKPSQEGVVSQARQWKVSICSANVRERWKSVKTWFLIFLWAIIIQPMYCEMWKENLWFSSLILYLSAAKNHRTSVRGRWRLLSSSKEPLIVIFKPKTFYICTDNYYEADHYCPHVHIIYFDPSYLYNQWLFNKLNSHPIITSY